MIKFLNEYFGITTSGLQNTSFLVWSSATAKVIFALGMFFLADYYGPESYGEFSVFRSYANNFSLLFLASTNSILLALNDYRSIKNLLSGMFVLIILSAFVGFVIIAVSKSGFGLFSDIPLGLLTLSIGSGILLSFNGLFNNLNNKYGFYKLLSIAGVLVSLATIFCQVLMYVLGKEKGLIYGFVMGLVVLFVYLFFHLKKVLIKPNAKLFRKTIVQYKGVLMFNFPTSILKNTVQYVIPILLSVYFGKKITGEYTLAFAVSVLPVFVFSLSLAKIYSQKISKLFVSKKAEIFSFSLKVSFFNFLLLAISMAILNTLGIWMIERWMNKEWTLLVEIIPYFSIYFITRGLHETILHSLVVFHQNKFLLIFHILLLPVYAVAFYLGYKDQEFLLFLKSVTLLSALMNILFFCWNLRFIYQKSKS